MYVHEHVHMYVCNTCLYVCMFMQQCNLMHFDMYCMYVCFVCMCMCMYIYIFILHDDYSVFCIYLRKGMYVNVHVLCLYMFVCVGLYVLCIIMVCSMCRSALVSLSQNKTKQVSAKTSAVKTVCNICNGC